MLHKIKAIVLRTTRYSETSVIALMYTDIFGMQSYMINGVRKHKARITAGMLQPLCLVDAEVYHKAQGDIQRLNELRLEPVLNGLLSDPSRGVAAMFAAEVLTRAIREEEGQQELFDYLSHHIQLLDIHPQPLFALLQLLLGLSARLGGDEPVAVCGIAVFQGLWAGTDAARAGVCAGLCPFRLGLSG